MKAMILFTVVVLASNNVSANVLNGAGKLTGAAAKAAKKAVAQEDKVIVKKVLKKTVADELKAIDNNLKAPLKITKSEIKWPEKNEVPEYTDLTEQMVKILKEKATLKRTKVAIDEAEWSGPKELVRDWRKVKFYDKFSALNFDWQKERGRGADNTIISILLDVGMLQFYKVNEARLAEVETLVKSLEVSVKKFDGSTRSVSAIVAKIDSIVAKQKKVLPKLLLPVEEKEIGSLVEANEELTKNFVDIIERYYTVTPKDGSPSHELLSQFVNAQYSTGLEQGRRVWLDSNDIAIGMATRRLENLQPILKKKTISKNDLDTINDYIETFRLLNR